MIGMAFLKTWEQVSRPAQRQVRARLPISVLFQLAVCRALLGLLEAGFFPGCA